MESADKHTSPDQTSPARPVGVAEALLLRVGEAARICGISRSLGYGLVAGGTWPSVRIGRAVRVPMASLIKWIEESQN